MSIYTPLKGRDPICTRMHLVCAHISTLQIPQHHFKGVYVSVLKPDRTCTGESPFCDAALWQPADYFGVGFRWPLVSALGLRVFSLGLGVWSLGSWVV